MQQNILLCNTLKQHAQDRRIRPVILESEFEMVAGRIPRPIFGRVDFLDDTFVFMYPMDAAHRHQGPVPVGDDIELVPPDKLRISCRSCCHRLSFVFTHQCNPEKCLWYKNYRYIKA